MNMSRTKAVLQNKYWKERTYSFCSIKNGFDFILNSTDNTITVYTSKVKVGDAIAVVGLIDGEYDFHIVGKTLYTPLKAQTGVSNCNLKLITFGNHDSMLMRTERFPQNSLNRYQISRPITNMSYVWVSVNGVPLKSNVEYDVMDDGVTVRLTDDVITKSGDEIVIRSMSDLNLASKVLGYKIFTDMLGRTHYKRLSKENTTRLTMPLSHTDTEINVENARLLTPPNSSKNLPGVVNINGERIEFLEITGNKLKKLRRGTFGTSPAFYLDVNTKVIDQGVDQTLPYVERINKQILYTTASVNTYVLDQKIKFITTYDPAILNQTTQVTLTGFLGSWYLNDNVLYFNETTTNSLDQLKNAIDAGKTIYASADGLLENTKVILFYDDYNGYTAVTINKPTITDTWYTNTPLQITFTYLEGSATPDQISAELEKINTDNKNAVNQISVFYGGHTLSKVGNYYHDLDVSYDSPIINLVGSTSTAQILPTIASVGDAYIIEENNQVWIYTASLESSAINGFVYKGLNYIEPQFTVNTLDNSITLNVKDGVQDNIELVIMQKNYGPNEEWVNTGTSILESTTEIAKFLQSKPAELPDAFYYGNTRDGELITENGEALLDITGSPLKGK